jgi:hypothetical protein
MSTNDYDVACRYLLRRYSAPLLRWLLRLREDQLRFQDWLEPQLTEPEREERVCDTIARLLDPARHGVPWAIIIEFQSAPDPDMLARLLEYLGKARRLFRPSEEKGDRYEVGAVVVNLTGAGRTFRRIVWKEAKLELKLMGREWNLAGLNARVFLRGVAEGALPKEALAFVPLMKKGGGRGIIQRWLELAGAEKDPLLRADHALAEVFANLTDHAAAWREALKEWDVNESPTVNRWRDEARAEGRVQGAAELLVALLENRFGKVPAPLRKAVLGATEVGVLRGWGALVLKAGSLDEFRREAGL